jgi:hypothetical protein
VEDKRLKKVIRSLPLDVKQDLVTVDGIEGGDSDLIVHGEVISLCMEKRSHCAWRSDLNVHKEAISLYMEK